MPEERLTKKQKREASREENRKKREEAVIAKKRNRLFSILGTALAIVTVSSITVVAVMNQPKPVVQVNPVNMKSDAVVYDGGTLLHTPAIPKNGKPTPIALTNKKVEVEIYYDYLCPYCHQFETVNRSVISKYMTNPNFTFAFHPLAFLGEYSMVAANATACIAAKKPEDWWQANSLLYDNQPDEAAAKGFSHKQNVDTVKATLASMNLPKDIVKCIEDTPYGKWSVDATNRMLKGPVPNSDLANISGTPTILVDGKQIALADIPTAQQFEKVLTDALAKIKK
jgi:protein-disulfide isomerase